MVSKAFERNVLRVTALLAFVAILVVAVTVLHVQDHVGDILDWIEEHKIAGAVSYVGLYALFTGQHAMVESPGLFAVPTRNRNHWNTHQPLKIRNAKQPFDDVVVWLQSCRYQQQS